MEKHAILSICLQIGSHLILFVFFVQFYLMEEMGDYIADRITTTSRFQEVSESEFPTVTICMDPPQKPSVASMYGFERLTDIHKKDVLNTTLPERLEASSYILNRDFYIKELKNDFEGLGKQELSLVIGDNDNYFIEPIITYLQGVCHKIDPKFKVTNFTSVTLRLYLNESNIDQPRHLVVYLTSPDATLNLAHDIWPQYLPGEVKLSLDESLKKKTVITYRTVEYIWKAGVENSSKCVTEIMEKSECKNNCFYISGSSLPICISAKDHGCIMSYYPQWQKCLLQKHAVTYVPKKNENLLYGKSSKVEIKVGAFSKSRQIMEEIDIITLSGLIGSVGGSLGMFFGFSITSYLSFVIERFVKKIFF